MVELKTVTTIDEADADEAYERVLPDALAVAPEKLIPINIDLQSAIATGQRVAKRLSSFQKALRTLPGYPMDEVARFPDYLLALSSAQARYDAANAPPQQLPALLDQATRWRDLLCADAKVLIARGHLNAQQLKGVTRVHGYKNLALDLANLSRMFRRAWGKIEGFTAVQLSELAEVDQIVLKLGAAVISRKKAPEQAAEAGEIRQRVFVLFHNSYDQIRRAIIFLRWHEGDADTIVPSLYAGRRNSNALKKPKSKAKKLSDAARARSSSAKE